ncbi:MAG: LPS export ABC transporter permease LptG [Deltaproteobacteria bacterium]|nr:LPS export ABC transporter permease LptG [Deltaproteobacteria bacterium]
MKPRILDRYIGGAFLKMFATCLGGFVALYILVDFIERSSQIFKSDPAPVAVALYFAYKLPLIVFQMIPVACLLGSLLSLLILARNSELTAIKAGGVPILRASVPIIALAALISTLGFLLNEYVVPAATQKREYIYKVDIKKQVWRAKYRKENVFYRSGSAIYSFGLFVPEQNKISDVRMYRLDDRFRIAERAVAASAQYQNGHWMLVDGYRWMFEGHRLVDTAAFSVLPIELMESPDDLKIYQRDPEEMSWRELRAYVGDLRRQGYDVTNYEVELHGKLAFPLVPIIMAIIGVPFAVRVGRSGGVAAGVGIAIVIGVVYWIVHGLALAVGKSGAIGPIVAAWSAHAVFGIGGLVGLVKVRQ